MNFRIINRIAKTELAALFFSPVAWILLVVFAVHIGVDFMDILRQIVRIKAMGREITFSATAGVVLGSGGIYEVIQDSIYLYIPLLTMNLMSREYASGSDKLLYSSPVSSVEIVAGKFLSMLFCSAIFTFILALPAIGVIFMVPHADIPLMLAGLLSMFLLIMTYCSIGLFMSSLTSYQVVAAVATLSALAFFNYVGEIGQNSPAIREITYWLSIKGRASEMVGGLVCSDDVIYFISVSLFFLVLTVIHLDNHKIRRTASGKFLRYGAAFAALVLVAFVSSRPAMKTFLDATYSDDRTLSKESQEVMGQLKGGMTITTYVNVLDEEFENFIPSTQMKDRDRFKMYTRFKPEIKMNYVYYYSPVIDTSILNRYPGMSDEEIARSLASSKGYKKGKLYRAEDLKDQIDLAEEGYQFVRVVRRESGEEARLRLFNDIEHHPSETEISAAMKKMFVEPVKVGTIIGHGERSIKKKGDRDYSIFATNGQFRSSMINQGFDLQEIDLTVGDVPESITILLIPDPLTSFSEAEMAVLDTFIERGGNIFMVTDVDRQDAVSDILSKFGLRFGETVEEEATVPARGTEQAVDLVGGSFKNLLRLRANAAVNMPGATSFEVIDTTVFKATPLLVTDSLTTSEPKTLAVALQRSREDGKEQRMVFVADADCFSNSFLQLASRQNSTSYNFNMLPTSFRWLCYGEFPVSSSRRAKKDRDIRLTPMQQPMVRNIYCILIPALIALAGFLVIFRRKRR